MTVDLRSATFEELLEFVFDHPTPPEGEAATSWWWSDTLDDDLEVEPSRQIQFMARLFDTPAILVGRYTAEQIDQAIWYMFGPGGEEWFARHIWNPVVPWDLRLACIRGIANLYPALFAHLELGEAPFMLWDLLTFGYDCGNRKPAERFEDHQVQEAMFAQLKSLLDSDDARTQKAALHGLGHISHIGSRGVVEAYLASDRWIESDLRKYAEGIAAGHVL
jgi:hypothetical protein